MVFHQQQHPTSVKEIPLKQLQMLHQKLNYQLRTLKASSITKPSTEVKPKMPCQYITTKHIMEIIKCCEDWDINLLAKKRITTNLVQCHMSIIRHSNQYLLITLHNCATNTSYRPVYTNMVTHSLFWISLLYRIYNKTTRTTTKLLQAYKTTRKNTQNIT